MTLDLATALVYFRIVLCARDYEVRIVVEDQSNVTGHGSSLGKTSDPTSVDVLN